MSTKLVLNRSADLLKQNASSFIRFKKEAKLIQEIQVNWTDRMKELQKKGFDEKDAMNLKKEASKLSDLEFLKNQTIPGPFTSTDEIDKYMSSSKDQHEQQNRLYVEATICKSNMLIDEHRLLCRSTICKSNMLIDEHRLYVEVRYARATCLSMNTDSMSKYDMQEQHAYR